MMSVPFADSPYRCMRIRAKPKRVSVSSRLVVGRSSVTVRLCTRLSWYAPKPGRF